MGYKFKDRPFQYYEKHKNEIKLNEEERVFLERVIYKGIDKKYIEIIGELNDELINGTNKKEPVGLNIVLKGD